MFKKSHNRAVLRIRIETVTPLLIRAGDAGLDPTAAELSGVRTGHARYGSTVYIPGSSLKGVLRAAAESSIRGRDFGAGTPPGDRTRGACNPLERAAGADQSCGERIRDEERARGATNDMPSTEKHRRHCLACRLFGSLSMKGRASVRDLFPWDPKEAADSTVAAGNRLRANKIETRQGVAIDRISGAARPGALYEMEVVPVGVSFWGEIALENYQAWQLGLVAHALDEVNDGFAQLGSTKSRGLGVARIDVTSIVHEQAASHAGGPAPVDRLAGADDRDAYGLFPETALPDAPAEIRGISRRFTVAGAERTAGWLVAGRDALARLA